MATAAAGVKPDTDDGEAPEASKVNADGTVNLIGPAGTKVTTSAAAATKLLAGKGWKPA